MVKTWQVGIIAFCIVSLILLPIGVGLIAYLHWAKKREIREIIRPNPEKMRKQYKMEWESMV